VLFDFSKTGEKLFSELFIYTKIFIYNTAG